MGRTDVYNPSLKLLQLELLKLLLFVVGWCFGLKVNLDKSTLLGLNLDPIHVSKLVEIFECKIKN